MSFCLYNFSHHPLEAWEVYFHNPSPAIIIVIFPPTPWCSPYLPCNSCPVARTPWQCGMVLPQWNDSLLTTEFWYLIPYSINKIQYFHWIMYMLIRYWKYFCPYFIYINSNTHLCLYLSIPFSIYFQGNESAKECI